MTKVFLSAGHGGSDPGAVANGLREKDINLQVMLACNEVLIAHGVQTVCSRTRDENDPVSEEVREANASGATLAASFHANAGGGHGFEGYYYSSDSNGKRLVDIATKYVAQLGQEAHGAAAKSGNKLMFVNSTSMTAVLFESFFIDSDDCKIGDTVEEQRAFGVAYAKAILEYLGIAYKGGTSAASAGAGVNTVRRIGPGSAHLYCDCPIFDSSWSNVIINAKKGDHITVLDSGTEGVKVKYNNTIGYMHCKYVMPDIKPGDKLRTVEDITITIKKGTQLVSQDSGYMGNKVAANCVINSKSVEKM